MTDAPSHGAGAEATSSDHDDALWTRATHSSNIGGMLLVYGLVAWFVFMITGAVNGTFRVAVLQTSLREYPAHVVSTLLLSVALLVEISVFLEIVGDHSRGWLIALGVMWTLLTVAFEFGFGRAVGQSWATLLENYDVPHGRIWPLVLLVLLLTPVLAG